jgi:hypothetical protein
MSLKHEIGFDENNPFANCKLDRKQYADVLTNIIENYPQGFVLAINNKWGTGKTTFVKMWEQELKNVEFRTVYFNAWENDFEDNPLTALIGELKDIVHKKGEEKFKKLVKNAAQITKSVAPAIIKAFLEKYLDSKTLSEALSDTSKSFLDIFEEDVKDYATRKKSITEFKKSLFEFVTTESAEKPLIFIIDELDRCRPNYAVSILEQIKHFFSVPNIVFVLSIDKTQLGHAICGVYGSEQIDTDEYLKRFIDIEYSIPNPEEGKFFEYLFEYFDFNTFFSSSERSKYREFQYEVRTFKTIAKILLKNLTLRQQEKILAHTRITLRTFSQNNYLLPTIFFFLIYIKTFYNEFYNSLANKNISLIEAQEQYFNIVRLFITSDNKRVFTQVEAFLLKFYENYKDENIRVSEILEYDDTTYKYVLKINSKIDDALFLEQLTADGIIHEYSGLKLSHFFAKINLTSAVIIN